VIQVATPIFWLLWAAGSLRVDLEEETPPATGLRLQPQPSGRRHSEPDGDLFNETTHRQVRRRSHLKLIDGEVKNEPGFAIALAVLESARASGGLPGTGRISRSIGRRHEKHRLQIISERGGARKWGHPSRAIEKSSGRQSVFVRIPNQ